MPTVNLPERFYLPSVATISCVIATFNVPYDYYMLLRLLLCGGAAFYISRPPVQRREAHCALLVALIVLHNPIVPVPLGTKLTWTLIDFATAAYFWWIAARLLLR